MYLKQTGGARRRIDRPPLGCAELQGHVELDRISLPRRLEPGERLDDRERAERQVIEAVAAFEEHDEPTVAELTGQPARLSREAAKALCRHAHAPVWIGGRRVLAGRDEDEVRPEALEHRRNDLPERVPVRIVSAP